MKRLRITKEKINNFRVSLFILLLFLLPQANNYRLYFGMVLGIAILSFSGFIFRRDLFVRIALALFFWMIFTTLLRFATIVPPNTKDLTELGRVFLPIFILVNSKVLQDFSFSHFVKVISIVVLIDFAITLVEFFYVWTYGTPLYETIKVNYWSETHWVSPYRSKGLTPGPGQHAVVAVFFFTIFLSNLLFGAKEKQKRSFVFVFITLFISVATLSRTGVFALFIALFIALAIYFTRIKKHQVFKIGFILSGATTLILTFVIQNQERFVRIFELVDTGLNNPSFNERGKIWNGLLVQAFDSWAFLLFGWGKFFFGESAHQTDNEYVFILLFYGLLFFVVFFTIVFSNLYKFLMSRRRKSPAELTLFIILMVGFVFAIPSAFFFYVQNLALLTIISIIIFHEKREKKLA